MFHMIIADFSTYCSSMTHSVAFYGNSSLEMFEIFFTFFSPEFLINFLNEYYVSKIRSRVWVGVAEYQVL